MNSAPPDSGSRQLAAMPRLALDGEHARILDTGFEPSEQRIAPGIARLSRAHFGPHRPMALAMEHAIAAIEDELARVPRELHGMAIASAEPALHALADAAGLAIGDASLTRDALEQVFARQSAVALGRPAASEGLPTFASFIPALLLVRELMHHLDIVSIRIDERGNPATNAVDAVPL